jgi:phenylacetate-CoA ligase
MNPFYNPVFLSKILAKYLFDIDRLKTLNEKELNRFRDKSLRNIVSYAYTVPLYHDKYKKAGLHPSNISGIKDIEKLPVITKEDIKKYYPNGIISSKTKKEKLLEISTSGTTGKKLTIYQDMYDVVQWFFNHIRAIREHGINWRKDRLTIIADLAPHTIESGFIMKGLLGNLNTSFFRNMQWLNTNDKPDELIKEINHFKPDFLGGYPGMLGHLALLKEQGYGEKINPKVIASTGGVLDKNLRKLIEEVFKAPVFELYGTTETGTIAFQCKDGHYHVMSDLVHLEVLKEGKSVSSKEPGKLIITKLYGNGTPIIRYNAINDIVAPLYEKTDCGMIGDLIDRVYGRDDLALYFSNGRILLPSSISEIYSKILYELKTTILKDTKIVQSSMNKIDIEIVLDEKQKESGVEVEKVFSTLKKGFEEKVGSNVDIHIKEVDKIHRKMSRIISKINKKNFEIKQYI